MICQLTIQNFGLIDKISLELSPALNILTGETGAGKSIVIDALRYALGERLDQNQMRDAAKPCVVEAVFELSKRELRENPAISEFLAGKDEPLIISRSHLPDGKTRIKINGMSVTVSQLKEVGNHLVDFHGPNDHQMLLLEDSHIKILDRLCDLGALKGAYSKVYGEYAEARKALEEIKASAATKERELDLLAHQIKELERVKLDQGRYEELLEKEKRLKNSEQLYENASRMIEIFENAETGIGEAISKAFGPMKTLNSLDEGSRAFAETLAQLQESNDRLINELRSYLESLSFEPDEARDIRARYDIYEEIKRKYGPAIEDAKNLYDAAKKRYGLLADLEHNDAELRGRIKEIESDLINIAKKLTGARKKTAQDLEKTIEKELKELGIKNVRFECRIEKAELGPAGQDRVIFYISPNAGEDLKPLAEIVSSGEAARVMLALKKALTKVDPMPVLIFDEIDSQIGGRLGTITGKKLRELSRDRQVILITHLPQIASFAESHFKVTKKVENNRTTTAVGLLDEGARVKELAKMMSGEKESSISITHAEEMLGQARAA
jgi:DNA repair protein RecN (Recombination protein N)